jgi:hypothetical protein
MQKMPFCRLIVCHQLHNVLLTTPLMILICKYESYRGDRKNVAGILFIFAGKEKN